MVTNLYRKYYLDKTSMCLPGYHVRYPHRLHPRKENGRLSVQLKELSDWMYARYKELDGYTVTWTYDTQPASLQMIQRQGDVDVITKWPANVKDVNCPKQEVVWGEPTTNPRSPYSLGPPLTGSFTREFPSYVAPNPYEHNPYRVASSFRNEPNITYQSVMSPSDDQVMATTYGTMRLRADQLEELQSLGYRRVGPSPTRLRPDGTVHVSLIDKTYRIVE